jgi:hypothetical protein
MRFQVIDTRGNLIGSFDDEEAALENLNALLEDDADALDDIALFVYDDEGHLAMPARSGSSLLTAVNAVQLADAPWVWKVSPAEDRDVGYSRHVAVGA